jgi:integrase
VLTDDLGLELLVTPAGAKLWRFRYRGGKKQRRITIGRYPDLGLAAARAEAAQLRARVWAGEDPGRREPEPAPTAAPEAVEPESVDDVVDRYIAEHAGPLGWKLSTARTYRSALATFTAWAGSSGVLTVADVTPAALARFRAHVVSMPRRAKAKGGSRRDVISTGEQRSAAAVNCEIRAVKTMLQALRRAGTMPELTSDAITDNLGLLPLEHARPDPLRPAQLRELLAACWDHDLEHEPIGPLVVTMLLGGLRLGEALRLAWDAVDLDELVIRVRAGKTNRERDVDLSVSPALARLLAELRGSTRSGPVFVHSQQTALDARQRLISRYGAPAFLWSTRHSRPGDRSAPTLRSTCGCYLTNAPSIFGAASIYRSAAQLGHSAEVAQQHYLGTLRRIPRDATTLEAAMQIVSELEPPSRGRLRIVGA